MLKDCKDGKIQAIYTKSVSRFARSVADLVDTVTMLRSLGIFVYFEEEKINSNDRHMELLLNILAVMAQEEARSLGENVRLMDQGLLHSLRCRMTPEQKEFLRDESWMTAQNRLEGKRIVIEGGYQNEQEN